MKASLCCAVSTLALFTISAPVAAEERSCTGRIGAVELDNILVPDGARCELNGTRARGNIVVGTGAALSARGVIVNGNLQGEGAASVRVFDRSSFGGSVQLVKGGTASIESARVNGDIQFDENSGRMKASNNTVGGNLQAFKNTGGVTLDRNTMKGNLQCKENSPAPGGRANRAASKEDQCDRL